MAKLDFNTADHTVEESEWRTFGEWRALNMGVLKGEKARRFRHGVAVFHCSQTAYMPDYCGDGDLILMTKFGLWSANVMDGDNVHSN